MPGIAGFWATKNKTHWSNKSDSFIRPMIWDRKIDDRRFDLLSNGVCLIAVASPTIRISSCKIDKRYHSVLFGKLYSVNSKTALTEPTMQHQYIVEEYLQQGASFLNAVEGSYLLAIFDSMNEELMVINDHFGSFPLNYLFEKGELIFSSQIRSIFALSGNTGLDETAFSEHLSMGLTINGRTFIKNIYRLWPGSVLKVSRNKLDIKEYFKPRYHMHRSIDIQDKLEEASTDLAFSFKNKLTDRHKTAAALTGGFDSRVLWSVILGQNIQARATTFGEAEAADVKIASQITKMLNISHDIMLLDQKTVHDYYDNSVKLVAMTEGFTNIEVSIVTPYYRWLKNNFHLLIDGTGSALYRRQVFHRYSGLMKSKNELPSFFYKSLLIDRYKTDNKKEEFIREFQSEILSYLAQYFTKYTENGTAEDLIDLFYLHHYIGFRFSSDLMFQTQYIDFLHPFCNTQTYGLMRKISAKERRNMLFHKYVIHKYESRLESIPLVNSGLLVPYKGFMIRRIFPIGAAYLKDRIGIKVLGNRYKRCPVFNFESAFRTFLLPFVKEVLLDPRTQNRPFWDGSVLEEMIRRHESQQINGAKLFFNIITAELFLREFIDGK